MSSPTDASKTISKVSGSDNRAPRRGRAGDTGEGETHFDIRIASDGTWYHEGAPIRRLAIARLFATVMKRDDAGDYWLVTPAERGRIAVDDAPFVAVELMVAGEGRDRCLRFRTNLDQEVDVGEDHPIRVVHDPATGEPRPYVAMGNSLEALIARSVYYQLVDVAENAGGRIGVWSKGIFHPLDPDPNRDTRAAQGR